jgi:hypothetical protein
MQLLQSGGCHILPNLPSFLSPSRPKRINSSTVPSSFHFPSPFFELHFKSILCDQIVPPDDPMEAEVKVSRELLRTLVVAFVAEDAS